MTVAELIQALQAMPQDMVVYVDADGLARDPDPEVLGITLMKGVPMTERYPERPNAVIL